MSVDYHGYLVYGIDLGEWATDEVLDALDEKDCPAALVGYGMDGSGSILAIESTLQSADVYGAEPVDLDLDKDVVAGFKDWCQKHGVNGKTGWLLAASVG